MTLKLNQVIAVEKGIKSRVYSEATELHKVSQKPDLFNGFIKAYRKKDEEGEDYPAESKKVVLKAEEVFLQLKKHLIELFDITATKDVANCNALANVVVEGKTIIKSVPATYLLFLEKQVNDIRTFIEALPTLDAAENWTKDENSGLFKTAVTSTHRSKKVNKPIVLYGATPEHPAQTQLIQDDVLVGYWDTTKYSGAIPAPKKQQLLDRVELFSRAIKSAREEANSIEATSQSIGETLFNWLLE